MFRGSVTHFDIQSLIRELCSAAGCLMKEAVICFLNYIKCNYLCIESIKQAFLFVNSINSYSVEWLNTADSFVFMTVHYCTYKLQICDFYYSFLLIFFLKSWQIYTISWADEIFNSITSGIVLIIAFCLDKRFSAPTTSKNGNVIGSQR